MNSVLDAKKKNKELVNKPDISDFIYNTGLDKKKEALTAKTKLNAEWDEIEKFQTYESGIFIGQS